MTRMYVLLGALLTVWAVGAQANESETFLRCKFEGGNDGKSKSGFSCYSRVSKRDWDVAEADVSGSGLKKLFLKCNGYDIYEGYAGVVRMRDGVCFQGITNGAATPPNVKVERDDRGLDRVDGTLYWAGHTLTGKCRWSNDNKDEI